MRVYVGALEGVFDLGLSAILDAFQTANELIQMTGLAVPHFEVKIVGVRKTVRTAHGLKVPIQSVGRQTPECVIVPAIACKTPDTLKAGLARPDVRDAAKASRTWARDGATLSALVLEPLCWLSLVCSTSSAQQIRMPHAAPNASKHLIKGMHEP